MESIEAGSINPKVGFVNGLKEKGFNMNRFE